MNVALLAAQARGSGIGAVLGTWWHAGARCWWRLVLIHGIEPEVAAKKIWGR